LRKIVSILVVLGAIFTAHQVQADDLASVRKLYLANMQSMLTQRLAKSACFIGTFTETEKHRETLLKSSKVFDRNHEILKFGNKKFSLPGENNKAIIDSLSDIEPVWGNLKFASLLLAETSQYPGLDVNMIANFNKPTLKLSDLVSEQYREGLPETDANVEMVKVTGRLSTLTQKAAKEFCLVSYGINVNQNRNALAQSIQEFEQILEDLSLGNEAFNITPPPTAAIEIQLTRLKENWKAPKRVMMAIVNSMRARTSDFLVISKTNDAVLKASRKVADLYLDHYKKTRVN